MESELRSMHVFWRHIDTIDEQNFVKTIHFICHDELDKDLSSFVSDQ
jgi:hypothetical protein